MKRINCTYTRDIRECPLGMVDCTPKKNDSYRPWIGCINSEYCKFVCEAWYLPLHRSERSDSQQVCLYNCPHNYSPSSYRKYMKKYGWAEAVSLPFWRGNDYLKVHTSIIRAGYAASIPLGDQELYEYNPSLYRSKEGLWWCGDWRSLRSVLKGGGVSSTEASPT